MDAPNANRHARIFEERSLKLDLVALGLLALTLFLGLALVSYDSYADALDAGAHVTHTGRCGLCSPLQDLAVYMREPDLTDLVRQCGLDFIMGPIRAVPSV